NGQIRQIQDSLIQQAEYLALLGEPDGNSFPLIQLVEGIKQSSSKLMLSSSIDDIEAFAPGNINVYAGVRPNIQLSGVSQQAQRLERAVVDFTCRDDCRISAAIPVLLEEGVGAVAVDTSIADVVLRVNQTSGWDVGVLMGPNKQQDSDIIPWNLKISALTNRQLWEPLINTYASEQGFTGQGQYLIERQGRKYNLALIPLPLLKEQQAFWVLVKDVTDSYQLIRDNNIQLLAVTWFSLLVSGLLLAWFIQPSLTALSVVASALPSLALHDYDQVRQSLKNQSRKGGKQKIGDELSILSNSTLDLTDELERLNREIKNRSLRLHRSSKELAKQREFVAGLLDNAQAVILVQDRNGMCRSINQFGRLLISRPESLCVNYHFEDLFGFIPAKYRVQLDQLFGGEKHVYRYEMQLNVLGGEPRTISWLHSRLKQSDQTDAVLSIGMDVTEQKTVQRQLSWLSNHDPLTELPNRTGLQRKLQSIVDGNEMLGSPFAVFFCDLDHFKNVNDSLGHPAGDKLLKQASSRLKSIVREGDTIARWGGDEFVIVVEHIGEKTDIHAFAKSLIEEMDKAYTIDGQEVFISVSVGISLYPVHGNDPASLTRFADIAMYKSKQDGRKQYSIYSSEQSRAYEERLHLDVDLRYALERQELLLYYQPQLSSDGSRVIGVEALIRWMHPDQGMIPPDRFIPLAEETGQIVDIGAWVLKEACRQLKAWEKKGIQRVRMSVNLAGPQIVDPSLLERVKHILNLTQVSADQLELEITESFIMSHPESTIAKLKELKDLGIKLAIDDFGTGYSSLSYLKKLPIDKLKIDKSFVFDIGLCADDEAIARAVIALGHSLNLTVIAEGVENENHVRFLKENGCDELQGFHFSKPLPADECLEFLLNYNEPNKIRC
ncbi:MAG: EAL domain-containing protein, partial [Motiliproteus sp.]